MRFSSRTSIGNSFFYILESIAPLLISRLDYFPIKVTANSTRYLFFFSRSLAIQRLLPDDNVTRNTHGWQSLQHMQTSYTRAAPSSERTFGICQWYSLARFLLCSALIARQKKKSAHNKIKYNFRISFFLSFRQDILTQIVINGLKLQEIVLFICIRFFMP